MPGCQLYLITPPRLDASLFAGHLAEALDAGPVAAVQLRLKDVDDDAIRAACAALMPVAHARGVAFLLNDRADLAAACRCDGVHIGQRDIAYAEARRLLGADAMIGVTCHNSRHLAIVAAEEGADYVAFGAFYDTATKDPPSRATPEILRWWSEIMTVPCVAIGGITVDNCPPLIEAGADFLAVTSGVWDHPQGPAAAVRAFAARCAGKARPA